MLVQDEQLINIHWIFSITRSVYKVCGKNVEETLLKLHLPLRSVARDSWKKERSETRMAELIRLSIIVITCVVEIHCASWMQRRGSLHRGRSRDRTAVIRPRELLSQLVLLSPRHRVPFPSLDRIDCS